MKRIAWLSDIHLNFVRQFDALIAEIQVAGVDGLLIGGDIGEAGSFAGYLGQLEARLKLPIYFVLGNHDYYGASVERVRSIASELSDDNANLDWLPHVGPVLLGVTTSLVGHGAWGDARLGDFLSSPVRLNDYELIENLQSTANDESLMQRLHGLGDEAAQSLERQLAEVPATAMHVFVLTHVPPFCEGCLHEGRIAGDDWLPHFTCHAVGEVLRQAAAARPACRYTVLCGHTHTQAECEILPNLNIQTAAAEYGRPSVERVFEVG